jgi:hypothetical protein
MLSFNQVSALTSLTTKQIFETRPSEKNWLNFFCLAEKNSFQKDFQPKVSMLSFRERIEREKTLIQR